jgi:hypothetical protein
LKVIEDAHQVAFVREAMVVSIVNMDPDNEAHELSPARTPAMKPPMKSLWILLVIYICI